MRRIATVVGLAALVSGFFAMAPAHAFFTPHQVTANVWRHSVNPGECIRTAYSAKVDSSGNTSGSISTVQFPCDDAGNATGPSDGLLRGTVSCLDVSGNNIVISGPITQQSGSLDGGYPAYQDQSTDNSTPSSPPNPDTDVISRLFGVTCSPVLVSQAPLFSGDVRIVY